MNLLLILRAIMRRWWLVLLCAAAGVPLAYELKMMAPANYQSTVSLQLNPAATSAFLPYLPNTSTNPYASPVQTMASSYREMLRTRAFGDVLVKELGLAPAYAPLLASSINTQLIPNTNILRLSITWNNPRDAEVLAQRVAEIFIAENVRRQQSQPGTQAHLSEMESSASDMQARVQPLEQQRQRLDDAVSRGDLSRMSELTELDQRLTALQTGYANLLVEINHVRTSFDTAVILDNATPAYPVETISMPQALAFGGIGGIAVGSAFALLFEFLKDAVRTPRDITGIAGDAPIARVRHARGRRGFRIRRQPLLVMLDSPRSPTAEAFRSLRATLQVMSAGGALRTLAISSPGPHDGKTFIACNLAVALAQSGKRVLLVDADLRRPRVHTWFNISNERGLADILEHAPGPNRQARSVEIGASDVVQSRVDNLWLLTAGQLPPNPGERLSSEAMASLLDTLGRHWDVVVIDTAPAEVVADTLLLAHQVDGCLLVARAGRTRRAALAGALAALRDVRQVVFGVVLNDEKPSALRGFSHADYYQLGYRAAAPKANGHQRLPVSVDETRMP
jgi:non-specific protein-tyrosine kinase